MPRRLKFINFLLMLLSVLMVLTACSGNEKEAVTEAETNAEQAFNDDAIEANVETEAMKLYVPNELAVLEDEGNNLLLGQKKQNYLLFYNQLEQTDSDALFNDLKKAKQPLLISAFSHEDRLGFIRIIEIEDGIYELIVGVGGTKMTTETKRTHLADDAQMMMKIVRSVEENQ